MLTEKLVKYEKFYIYGAQVVAYGAYIAINHLCHKKPECFLVSNLENNPTEIDGIAVKLPNDISDKAFVIVAVTELLQGEIVKYLRDKDITNVFCLTQHEEHILMSAYFSSISQFPLVKTTTENTNLDLAMYEVRNHRDKPLSTRPALLEFEHTIQAGAAITGERIATIADNTGDNISERNQQYCEITATYWVWKNTQHQWKGIEHYRRHLLVQPIMLTDDTDAILPLPYICYPNTLTQFRRFVGEDVVQALLHALKYLHPDEYDDYVNILCGRYQYTYNLVCARESVLNDYCSWFFRITEYMETLDDTVPDMKNTRALSYVAEVLTNIYFMSHKDVWQIRHTEKEIFI